MIQHFSQQPFAAPDMYFSDMPGKEPTGSIIEDEANSLGETLGSIMKKLESELNLPKDKLEAKRSWSLDYDISAKATFHLKGEWEIFKGFKLEGVKLKIDVSKSGKKPAILSVEINAYLMVNKYKAVVTGKIPFIGKGHDIEFVLKVESSSEGALDTEGLIDSCTKGDADGNDATKKSSHNLIENAGLLDDAVDAARAELIVVRTTGSGTFYLKKFEIKISAKLEWNVIPGKFRLENAAGRLHFSKKSDKDPFLAQLELAGRVSLQDPPKVKIGAVASLSLQKGDIVLALKCNVSAGKGVDPTKLVGLIADQKVPDLSSELVKAPPSLDLKNDNSLAFFLSAALERKEGKWAVRDVSAAIQVQRVWAPFPKLRIGDVGAVVVVCRPELKVDDGDDSTDLDQPKEKEDHDNTDSNKLKISGWLTGVTYLYDLQLNGTVQYDSGILHIRCRIPDSKPTSFTKILANPRIHSLKDEECKNSPTEDELSKTLDSTAAPSGCPVDFWMASSLYYGTERKCRVSFKGSSLHELQFVARSAGAENGWELTETISIHDMGLSISFKAPTDPKTGTGALKGYAYGHLKLSNNLTLFALIAGRKEDKIKEFFVHVSATLQPQGSVGMSPKKLFGEPAMKGLKPETEGWQLPSSLPAEQRGKVSDLFQSASVGVSLKMAQREVTTKDDKTPKAKTSLDFAHVYIDITGNWTIFDGLCLQDLSLHALIMPASSNKPAESSTTQIQLKGAFHVPTDESGYYIVMSALFDKQNEASSFTARLTASSNAGASQDRVTEDSQQRLPLSPSSILGLSAFGGKKLDATDQGSVTADFPIQPTELQSSTNVECTSEVGKNKKTGKWGLDQLVFSLSSDREWEVISGLLSLKLLRFDLQVKNPKKKTREILASAAVNITINKLLIESTLLFRKGQQGNILLFELKVWGNKISPMLQHLTGQSAESLPSESPEFKDNALFTVRIICAWVPDDAATGKTKRWLQSIEIDYQPTDKLDLDPFQVRNLQLSLLWKPPGKTGKRTAPEVSFKGEVLCGKVPVDIALSYETSPSRQWTFKLLPHEDKPLHLSDLCQDDKKDAKTLPKPKYDLPTGSESLDGLKMSGIHGVYGLESTNVPKSKLLQLDADIESGQVIDILDLDGGVKIQLYKLSLHWKYRDNNSKPESTGQVFAHLGCRKEDKTGDSQKRLKSDVLVEFKKDQDGREIFKGSLELNESFPDTDQPINYEELLEKFLPPDSHETPNDLEAPSEIPLLSISVTLIRHQSIELSAKGKTQWDLPLERTKLRLDYLGLYLKAEKAGRGKDVKKLSTDKDKTAIEVAITGGVTLNNLQSTDALRASLSIKRGSANILRASLKRSRTPPQGTEGEGEGDLKQLIHQLTGTPFDGIAPGVQTSLAFNETASVQLDVDFTKASNFRMILRGQIVGLGTVFFFTRKATESASKREYVLYAQSPSLKSLINMSSSFSSDTQGTFDLAPIEAGVISYDGTVKDFNADINEDIKPDPGPKAPFGPKALKSSDSAIETASAAPTPTKPLLMIPDKENLKKGFWVFAGIQLGGEGTMTEALKAVANPQKAPKVTFYGMISTQSREYGILINDLYILDDSIRIDRASGTYRKDNTKKEQSLNLKATLSLLSLGGNGVDYSIDVNVAITSSKTTFSVQESASYKIIEVRKPFGKMFNVTLSLQSVSGEITYDNGKVHNSDFNFVGRAAFAGKSSTKVMEGRIIFSNGTPQVVAVDFKKLPVQGADGLFGSVIQPNAGNQKPASWPDDYPDLELINGSIYYARKEITIDEESKKKVYHAGYNVEANLKLLSVNFGVLVEILPKRAGVSINSILGESIELPFLELSKLTLAVLAQKGAKKFSLSSDVKFFEEVDLALALSYEPASKSKSKSARYSGKLSRVEGEQQKPFVTIYYQDGHWGFEDWDIPWQPEDGPRLDKAIEKATESQSDCECEALIGMVFKEAIVPRFNWKITSPADKTSMFKNGTLNMRVVWSYDITVPLLDLDLLGFSLPDVPLILKGPFNHAKIHELLLKVIEDNLQKIGQAILDRPDDFFKVISVITLDHFGPKIIASLVCRQKKAGIEKVENLQKRAEELMDDEIKESHKDVDNDTGKLDGLERHLTGGGGNGIGKLLAGLAALSALLSGKKSKSKPVTDASPDHYKDKFKERLEKLEKAQEGLRERAMKLKEKVEAALALAGKPCFEVTFGVGTGEPSLSVDWTGVLPALINSQSDDFKEKMSWTVDISNSNGENIETRKTRGLTTSASFPLPSWASEGTTIFKAKVRGSCQCSETTYTAPWSSTASLTYRSQLPVPPDNVMLYPEYGQEPSIKVEFTPTVDGDFDFTLVSSGPTFNAIHSTQASITREEGYKASWKILTYLEQLKKLEALRIWVRQVPSPMEPRRTPSAWVLSKHQLHIAPCPSLDPVTGFYSEDQALLEWPDAWKSIDSGYLVQRIDASGAVVHDPRAFEEADALPGMKAFTVNNPDLAFPGDSHQGEVLISPTPASVDKSTFLLPQRFHVKLDHNLKISPDSLVLKQTNQVALYILGDADSPNDPSVLIEGLDDKGRVSGRHLAAPVKIKNQCLHVFWPKDAPSEYLDLPQALRVTAVDPTRPDRRLGLPSELWTSPDTNYPELPSLGIHRNNHDEVEFSWRNPSGDKYWFLIRDNPVWDPDHLEAMFETPHHTKGENIILPIRMSQPTSVWCFITRGNVMGPCSYDSFL